MKTLICTEPGVLRYQESADPEIKEGHVILKILRVGICGTDLHAFEGTQPYFTYPRILGHELAALIVDGTIPPGISSTQPLTFIPYFHCGRCVACRNGQTNCCVDMKVCGVHVNGGMAEYLSVPSASLIQGSDLSEDALALVEPLAIGAHALRRAMVMPGEFVLVMGAGPIGCGIIAQAQADGARVIAMDINQNRLAFCKDQLSVAHVVNATHDPLPLIREITQGDLATVVIDATGSQRAINDGFQYMAHGGRYVLVGLQKGDVHFSHPEFHKKESTLMSSRNATRQDFLKAMHALTQRDIRPETFITHRASFSETKEKFQSWLSPDTGVMKAMVSMP